MKNSILLYFLFLSFNALAQSKADTTIYDKVDVQAEFPGGVAKMLRFIGKNFKFSNAFVKANASIGKQTAKLVIEKDGKISNIVEISPKVGFGMDEELARVIKLMPNWQPAQLKGEAVRSFYSLPVNICRME